MECKYKETDTKSKDSSSETKLAYHQFNQSELNDLVCDLDLSKQAAELLASRLNEKHLLDSFAKVSFFQKRDELFLSFFRGKAAGLLQWHTGLLGQLGISSYDPGEWRLFLDSSKCSLKCILLHNGKVLWSCSCWSLHCFEGTAWWYQNSYWFAQISWA